MAVRFRTQTLALAAALAALSAGCTPGPPPAEPACPPADGAWRTLYDGTNPDCWHRVQGQVAFAEDRLILGGREGTSTVLAPGFRFKNGVIEVRALRSGGDRLDGPWTVSLRIPLRPDWTSLAFVCWPGRLEARPVDWRNHWPDPLAQARFTPADRPRTWRFILKDGAVRALLGGRHILTAADPDPVAGTLGLTSHRCRIEVLSVRYRPAE
jgi:hypothetical protein